jgi:flagellar basal body P-ring formation protein FlgA
MARDSALHRLARPLCGFVVLVAIAADEPPSAPEAQVEERVVVTLRPAAVVIGPRICIKDVATLDKGNLWTRELIGELDLADLSGPDKPVWMLREQVFYRIRMTKIRPDQFRVEGADAVRISQGSPQSIEEEIVAAAKTLVLERIPAVVQDASIQLAAPISGIPARPAGAEKVRFEANLQSPAIPIGRVHVDVTLLSRDRVEATVAVHLIVRYRQKVAVASRRVDRGEALTDKNVYLVERTLDSLEDYLTAPQDLAGQRTKRPLQPGQILTRSDCEPAPSEMPVLVKQQTLVKIIARLGGLELVTMGEAMQDGRGGQLIRVRNIDSRNVVVGRVVDRSSVQVDY